MNIQFSGKSQEAVSPVPGSPRVQLFNSANTTWTLLHWLIFCFLSVFLPQSASLLFLIWGHAASSLLSGMSNCFLKCSMGSVENKCVSLWVSQILFPPIFSAIYSFKPHGVEFYYISHPQQGGNYAPLASALGLDWWLCRFQTTG